MNVVLDARWAEGVWLGRRWGTTHHRVAVNDQVLEVRAVRGDMVATFRISTGWKIDEKVLQGLVSGISVSAEGLKDDLEDMDWQTARHVTGGRRHFHRGGVA